MKLKYIYGIVQAAEGVSFGSVGLGGSPVHAVGCQGLACLLSDYSGEELVDIHREKLVQHLLIHQAVVERVMAKYAVLPVKFGTLLNGEGEVRGLLAQGQRQLSGALTRIQGKIEVEVAATWDTEEVLGQIAREPQIVWARDAIAGLPAEKTLQERIPLGQIVKEALDRRRDGYRQRMIEFLSPLALDVQPNTLVSDQMVMNVAFLVEKAREEEFDHNVRKLNDVFSDQINFRVIGPLPPYSFSTVDISRPNWSEIQEARRALGLGNEICESEVRSACRNLAATYHPDLNPGDEAAERRLSGIRNGAAVLLAYCRGVSDTEETDKRYPITKKAVESAFLITIKRSVGDDVDPARFGGLWGQT